MRYLLRLALVWIFFLSAPWGVRAVLAQAPSDTLATFGAINCDRRGNSVLVSFRVDGAFGPEVKSTLESGQKVTYIHEMTVSRRRGLWFPKTLATMRIEVAVSLDTLTQRYSLSRTVGGGDVETKTTDRAAEAERWLTEVRDAKVALPPGATGSTFELKVKTVYGHDFLLFLLPWPLEAVDKAECR